MTMRNKQSFANLNSDTASRETGSEIASSSSSADFSRDTQRVGIVYDQRMELHVGLEGHPERPDRTKCLYEHVKSSGLFEYLEEIPSKEATRKELMRVHPQSHIDKIFFYEKPKQVAAFDEKPDPIFPFGHDTYVNKHTPLATRLAAGSVINLCDAVMDEDNDISTGFAMIRPPGHHAGVETAMGFCFFNNIAVAARHLQEKHGLKKIAIIDWDVHHGNGTNDIFLNDPSVLFMSFHRSDEGKYFPGTGKISNFGDKGAEGYTINVPLAKGFGDQDCLYVFDHIFAPAIKKFEPDFILVSSGFDAAQGDPLGHCTVTPRGFAAMTNRIYSLAPERCIFALEGGYSVPALNKAATAVLEELVLVTSASDERLSNFLLEKIEKIRQHEDPRLSNCSTELPISVSPNENDTSNLVSPKSSVTLDSSKSKKNKVPQVKTVSCCRQTSEIHNGLDLEIPLAPKYNKKKGMGGFRRSSYGNYPFENIESF